MNLRSRLRRPGAPTGPAARGGNRRRAGAPERAAAPKRATAPKRAAPSASSRVEDEHHPLAIVGRRTAVVATVLAVTLVLVALPARSYFSQQSDVSAARAELRELERANQRLEARRERLSDPDEIARIARRDYGLVDVGQESYSVLPTAAAGLVMPQAWPFEQIEDAVRTTSGGG